MYTQLIPWTQLNHSQLSLCNNSEKLRETPQIYQRIDTEHHFPLNIWTDSATGMIFQLQLKTKGKSAERSPRKDWNGIEKRMAHRAPIISTTVELWRLYGWDGTLCRTVPKGDQDRLL